MPISMPPLRDRVDDVMLLAESFAAELAPDLGVTTTSFSDDARGRYQALKLQLDTNIGLVLKQLRDSGQWENTMVLVVSDNGGTSTAYPSNAPFAGVKAGYGEGGIRTPLILSWPGHWQGGETRDSITMIFDLFPSILAALGLPVPADMACIFVRSTA